MRKYSRYVIICTAAFTFALTGCGSNTSTQSDTAAATETTETPATAAPTVDPATEDANGTTQADTAEQNKADATTEDTADTALGEGSNMVSEDGSVAIEDTKKGSLGKEITCSKDGKDLYTITIDSVVLTADRNDSDETQPDRIAKVTFTYKNIAAQDLLIDSYSFLLEDNDKSACQTYALTDKDETMPSAPGESMTRTIAYALYSTGNDVTLYYNAVNGDGTIYDFPVTLEEEK